MFLLPSEEELIGSKGSAPVHLSSKKASFFAQACQHQDCGLLLKCISAKTVKITIHQRLYRHKCSCNHRPGRPLAHHAGVLKWDLGSVSDGSIKNGGAESSNRAIGPSKDTDS